MDGGYCIHTTTHCKDLRCLSTQHVTFVVAVTSYVYPHAGTTWCQFIVSGASCVRVQGVPILARD